jgi:hypothetical protein
MSERVPRIRNTPLPRDGLIIVRGEDWIDTATAAQAERFRRRFPDWGRWGLSALHARTEEELADIAAGQLVRYPLLGVYMVEVLEAAGFDVVPTFRTPHVTVGFVGDLEDGLRRFRGAVHERRVNPYYESGPEEVNS